MCDQLFENEDIVFSHETDILTQFLKIELTYRLSQETDRHLHLALEDRPPRYSWDSEEVYKNLKECRKRMKKFWKRVMDEIEKGRREMKREQIERIITLENKRKEMELQIRHIKEEIEENKSGFSIAMGRATPIGIATHRGIALPLIPVSIEIVEMAIEEFKKELQAIKQELEAM